MTDKQKAFVVAYIENDGNKTEAAKVAFNPGSEKAAQTLGSRMLRKYGIRMLLAEYYGHDVQTAHVSRGELLSLISKRLRKAATDGLMREFNQLAGLYAEVKGWKAPSTGGRKNVKPPEEPDVLTGDEQEDVMKLVYKLEQQKRGNDE
jgi:hypothetical protein